MTITMTKNVKIFISLAVIVMVIVIVAVAPRPASATHSGGNINPNNSNAERYAWTDVIGWIDFDTGSVNVSDTQVTGIINSLQVGEIALDCSTTPNGDICAGASGNWGVANDGNGNLSGWAWSDAVGWISFFGAAPNYQVVIDPANGDFSGWAWNDVIGWISFNCNNVGIGVTCPPDYKVKTSWRGGPPPPDGGGPGGFDSGTILTSSVFDTQTVKGAAFNTIMWQGSLNGGRVGFQIATADSSTGPWNYLGWDGTSNTVYEPGAPNTQMKISRSDHNNKRYVRYQVYFSWAAQSPVVNDVIISYSP